MIHAETLDLLGWSRLCEHLSTFAATKLGRLAAQRLAIPASQSESEQVLAQTEEAYWLNTQPNGLRFSGVKDISLSLERAERQGVLSGEELQAIATTLNGARQLRRMIDAQDNLPMLQALVSDLRTYPELEKAIHHCIDDHGDVSERASPKLAGIREQLRSCRTQIYQKLQSILQRQAGAVQEALITQRSDRFVIPVKAPQKESIPGIVHDASTSGATLYVEPRSVVELGNRLRQLQRRERAEEEIVLRELTQQVAEVQLDLEQLLVIVTTLDLATARARYSLWLQGNPPRFVSVDEQTTLRQLRHPLLMWLQHHEEGSAVVPIDAVIHPQLRVVAITGPNTGGKTVTLKTLGLAALMAKAGLFVPAKEPVELPWFEQVLADIGDEQSIEQSLSTFSGHIKRISRILSALHEPGVRREASDQGGDEETRERGNTGTRGQGDGEEKDAYSRPITQTPLPTLHAPANALILLDEVGAGTDPSEGSALAIALLKHLADHARLTVATTHYGELKALKYQDERFENASVEFDDVSLSPTYRLLWGIPGRSNALTIARRLGLEPAVLDVATQYVGVGRNQDVNQVIAGLEAQRKDQELKAGETAQLLAQTERLHEEVARKANMLKVREQELQLQQEQAIQQAIADAKADIAKVIRRLQQGDATARDAQQATEAVNAIAANRLPSRQLRKVKPSYRPKVGERVRIPSLAQTAEVLTEPDVGGEMAVRLGLMKMTLTLADVESLQGEKAEIPLKAKPQEALSPSHPSVSQRPPAPIVRTSRNTVDLRGKRVAESEPIIEEALAHANGAIWVIHGHGTGKLKRGVREFLKRHPQVQRFEDAEQADGGSGVTVAYV